MNVIHLYPGSTPEIKKYLFASAQLGNRIYVVKPLRLEPVANRSRFIQWWKPGLWICSGALAHTTSEQSWICLMEHYLSLQMPLGYVVLISAHSGLVNQSCSGCNRLPMCYITEVLDFLWECQKNVTLTQVFPNKSEVIAIFLKLSGTSFLWQLLAVRRTFSVFFRVWIKDFLVLPLKSNVE